MENNVDGAEAKLTVGEPYVKNEQGFNANEPTNGMIRNDVRHDIDEFDVMADFIGNNYDYNGYSDVDHRTQVTGNKALDQQGFFMNEIPKVMYATNSNAEKYQEARYFVQLRDDLRDNLESDGSDEDPWTKSYNDFWIEVNGDGYRLTDLDENGQPKEDTEPIDTYQIARFKWRYSNIAAYGQPEEDNKETYLTMDPVEIIGIAKYADNNQQRTGSSYQYTRDLAVGITGYWRHDHLSLNDEGEVDSYRYQISGKSELTVRRRLPQVVLDSQSFAVEDYAKEQYLIQGVNDIEENKDTNAKTAAQLKQFAEASSKGEMMPENEANTIKGYRPKQKIWNKVTLLALNREEQDSKKACSKMCIRDSSVGIPSNKMQEKTK